jgi:hypothetical protein
MRRLAWSRWPWVLGAWLLGCSPAASGTARNGQTAEETGTGGTMAVIETSTGGTPGMVVGGGDDASGGTGARDCGHQDFTLAQKPADVLVVLDRSASMVEDMTPTKWSMVVPALQAVIDRTRSTIAWGLKVFPEGTASQCTQPTYPDEIVVPIGPGNADAVIYGIATAVPSGNGTPTGDAVNEAVKYLSTVATPNPKYILLATDGEPSCTGMTGGTDSTAARAVAVSAVAAAAAAGLHTFVVGIATTKESATTVLNDLAVAGKEPRRVLNSLETKYYLASTANELLGAFNTITSVVATCSFDLAKEPPDRNLVNVYLGADEPVSRDLGNANGWNYVAPDSLTFQLYGSACDRVKSRGAQNVNVVYVCPGETVY